MERAREQERKRWWQCSDPEARDPRSGRGGDGDLLDTGWEGHRQFWSTWEKRHLFNDTTYPRHNDTYILTTLTTPSRYNTNLAFPPRGKNNHHSKILHQSPRKAFISHQKQQPNIRFLTAHQRRLLNCNHQIQTQSLQNEGASIIFGKTEEKAAKAKEEE